MNCVGYNTLQTGQHGRSVAQLVNKAGVIVFYYVN